MHFLIGLAVAVGAFLLLRGRTGGPPGATAPAPAAPVYNLTPQQAVTLSAILQGTPASPHAPIGTTVASSQAVRAAANVAPADLLAVVDLDGSINTAEVDALQASYDSICAQDPDNDRCR